MAFNFSNSFFPDYFRDIASCVDNNDLSSLSMAHDLLLSVRTNRKKVLIAGNGGSAAMASHVCVDLVKVGGVRAVNFNEADLITCFSNDYGYERWVERALEFYADSEDVVVLISSSGQSANMLNAANRARDLGLSLITLSGFSPDNPLRKLGDINLWAQSSEYNIVEMTHHIWLLALVDKLALDAFGHSGEVGL